MIDFIIIKTKLYFEPLAKAWFWKYVFPVVVSISAFLVYLESLGIKVFP